MARHVTVVVVLGFVSSVVAVLVTPADPVSMIVVAVPMFVMALSAYWFGFRKAKRQSNGDSRDAG